MTGWMTTARCTRIYRALAAFRRGKLHLSVYRNTQPQVEVLLDQSLHRESHAQPNHGFHRLSFSLNLEDFAMHKSAEIYIFNEGRSFLALNAVTLLQSYVAMIETDKYYHQIPCHDK